MTWTILQADARQIPLADKSVDAIVTDPPYGLEFMGKEWDRLWAKRDPRMKRSSPRAEARRLPARVWWHADLSPADVRNRGRRI
jgi:site-specific DNA-methyltransferase (adenine-specific)